MSLPPSRRSQPEHIEDALTRLILTFLLHLDPSSSSSTTTCTQSFLAAFRAHLDSHLTTLVRITARSAGGLGSSTAPSGRDWIKGLRGVGSSKSVYGMQWGELSSYLRGRGEVDTKWIAPISAPGLGTGVALGGVGGGEVVGGSQIPPLGRFGSAYGRSHAIRSLQWGPSTDDWLDSEDDDEEQEQDPKSAGAGWEIYPSHSTSSRDQVRPVPHSGFLFKPPKQPIPIFQTSSSSLLNGEDPSAPPPPLNFASDPLAFLLDPDAPPPPIGTIPNSNPPPLPTQQDSHGMLTKQTLAYLRAIQDVIPPHLPAFPPRHTWRRTPVWTSTLSSSSSPSQSQGSSTTTLLVDRKLHAARLAQNSLRRLISATEEASARAAELEMEEREERARRVGEGVEIVGKGEGEDVRVVLRRLTPPASPSPPPGVMEGKGKEKEDDVVMVEDVKKEGEGGGAKEGGLLPIPPRKKRKSPRPPGWGDLVLQPFTSTAPTGFFASSSSSNNLDAPPTLYGKQQHFTQRSTLPTMLRYGSAFVPSEPTLTVHQAVPAQLSLPPATAGGVVPVGSSSTTSPAIAMVGLPPSGSGRGSIAGGEMVTSPTSILVPPILPPPSSSAGPIEQGSQVGNKMKVESPGGGVGVGPSTTMTAGATGATGNRPRLSIKLKARPPGGVKPGGAGSP